MFKRGIQYIAEFLRQKPDESDLFLCAGIESLFYGTHLIFPPAAYILCGFAFVGLAVLQARGV